MLAPKPSRRGDLLGDGHLVAGHHPHADAHRPRRIDRLLESSRGGSKRGSTPRNRHWVVVIRAGHTEGTEATSGKLGSPPPRLAVEPGRIGGKSENHLWRALGGFESVTVGRLSRWPPYAYAQGQRLEVGHLDTLDVHPELASPRPALRGRWHPYSRRVKPGRRPV